MTRLGQLVQREATLGGGLLMAGTLQFIASMILVQLEYPGYSLAANYISDFGNSQLSPWAFLFNDSIRAIGVLGFLGFLLARSAFFPGAARAVSLGFFLLANVGAFLVGTFPEGSPQLGGQVHGLVSALTFVSSGAALVTVAFAMRGDVRWEFYGLYSFVSGLVTFAALIVFLYASGPSTVGAWERLIVSPVLLWGLVGGLRIVRLPRLPPSPFRGVPSHI